MKEAFRHRRIGAARVAVGAALSVLALATPVQGQEEPPATPTEQTVAAVLPSKVDSARMEAYVAAYLETSLVAREFYDLLATTFEAQRKTELKTAMAAAIDSVRVKHGVSDEEYGRITYFVSSDEGTRAAFEALVAKAEGTQDPVTGG